MTVPIAEGSVDEVHTLVDRPAERPQRLVVVSPEPHGLSDPPGAVTELGHLQTGLTQAAVVHRQPPASNVPAEPGIATGRASRRQPTRSSARQVLQPRDR